MIRPNQTIVSALGFPYMGDPSLTFRPAQCQAVNKNLEAYASMAAQEVRHPGAYPVPVLILHAPTGTGKTLAAVATAVEYIKKQPDPEKWQVVYVVSTKLHQDEVTSDFPDFADLRGRQNFTCFEQPRNQPADRLKSCAECAHTCRLAGSLLCHSSQQSLAARQNRYVVTNYSMWLTYGLLTGKWPVPKQLDPVENVMVPLYEKLFVVFDEAHDLVKEMTTALTIEISRPMIIEAFYGDATPVLDLFPWPTSVPEKPKTLKNLKWNWKELEPWVEAAKRAEPLVSMEHEFVKDKVDKGAALHNKLQRLDKVLHAVRMLAYANPYDWLLQVRKAGGSAAVQIRCVRLENKVKPLLIQQANAVGLMSATISQCGLAMLGFNVKTVIR